MATVVHEGHITKRVLEQIPSSGAFSSLAVADSICSILTDLRPFSKGRGADSLRTLLTRLTSLLAREDSRVPAGRILACLCGMMDQQALADGCAKWLPLFPAPRSDDERAVLADLFHSCSASDAAHKEAVPHLKVFFSGALSGQLTAGSVRSIARVVRAMGRSCRSFAERIDEALLAASLNSPVDDGLAAESGAVLAMLRDWVVGNPAEAWRALMERLAGILAHLTTECVLGLELSGAMDVPRPVTQDKAVLAAPRGEEERDRVIRQITRAAAVIEAVLLSPRAPYAGHPLAAFLTPASRALALGGPGGAPTFLTVSPVLSAVDTAAVLPHAHAAACRVLGAAALCHRARLAPHAGAVARAAMSGLRRATEAGVQGRYAGLREQAMICAGRVAEGLGAMVAEGLGVPALPHLIREVEPRCFELELKREESLQSHHQGGAQPPAPQKAPPQFMASTYSVVKRPKIKAATVETVDGTTASIVVSDMAAAAVRTISQIVVFTGAALPAGILGELGSLAIRWAGLGESRENDSPEASSLRAALLDLLEAVVMTAHPRNAGIINPALAHVDALALCADPALSRRAARLAAVMAALVFPRGPADAQEVAVARGGAAALNLKDLLSDLDDTTAEAVEKEKGTAMMDVVARDDDGDNRASRNKRQGAEDTKEEKTTVKSSSNLKTPAALVVGAKRTAAAAAAASSSAAEGVAVQDSKKAKREGEITVAAAVSASADDGDDLPAILDDTDDDE
jgi:hypothetical protein